MDLTRSARPDLEGPPESQHGAKTITFDHHLLFAALSAPAGLDGIPLFLAVALARWAVLIGPAVLLWLWVGGGERDRTAAIAAGVSAVLGLAGAAALSTVVTLPRPFMDGAAFNYLDHVRDGSFPSDHATFMFSLAFSLLLWRPPRLPRAWLPLLFAAIAIGWARVFLNTHYPVDILGGAMLGALAAALATAPALAWVVSGLDRLGEVGRSVALRRRDHTGQGRSATGWKP